MTPRTTTAEDGAYVQRLGYAHSAHLHAVIVPHAAAQHYLAADTPAS